MNQRHEEESMRTADLRNTHPSGASAAGSQQFFGKVTWSFIKFAIGRWWRVATPVGVALAAGAAAYVYFVMGPTYEAEAWLRIEDLKPSLAFQNADSPRFVNTQIELIRSPMVLGAVVAHPDVAKLPEIANHPTPITWLATRISIRPVGGSELYKIVLETPHPANAALICNTILDSYLKVQSDFSETQMQRTVELLETEIQRRTGELDRRQRDLKDLAKKVTGKDPAFLVQAKEQSVILQANNPLEQLMSRLASAEAERQILEVEQKAAQELLTKNDAPITPEMINDAVDQSPEIRQILTEIESHKNRIFEAKSVTGLGDSHPSLKHYRSLLERSEAKHLELRESLPTIVAERLKAERRRQQQELVKQMELKIATQVALEAHLKEQLSKQREEMQALGDHSLELEFAREDLLREGSVFERIAERCAALRTEMRAPGRVTPLKRSLSSDVKLTKDPNSRMWLYSLAAILVPFALALLWEQRVRRVADSDQVSQEASLPVIAEISDLPQSPRGQNRPSRRYEQLRSMYEESVDLLRNSLTLPDRNGDVQVIAICSAVSGEGKTSLSCQLTVSLARAVQKPVLLIDADMRAPDVHHKFDLRSTPGLAEVLSRQATLGESIQKWSENVHVLPAGKLARSPHMLVNGQIVEELLKELRPHYRFIVIDSPPLLAASESFVLAKAADGALICAMRDVSKAPQIRFASERLFSTGVRPLGLVLNGVRSNDYGSRYGGYSYYRSNYESAAEGTTA